MNDRVSQEIEEHRVRWSVIPHIYELDELFSFCCVHKEIYIYGKSIDQEMLAKYLNMSGVDIKGYIVSYQTMNDGSFVWNSLPVLTREEAIQKKDVGIIMGLPDTYYNWVIPWLQKKGFMDYFLLTEHSKHAIAQKIRNHTKCDIQIEINIVDHCNLNCQCCDHFSPIADKSYLDIEVFERDIKRLSKLTDGTIGVLKLLGGEPLLHNEICEFMRIAREYFPEACIQIFSNGLVLGQWRERKEKQGSFWKALVKYEIQLNITQYPINLEMDEIVQQAGEHGVRVVYEATMPSKNCLLWICSDFAHRNEETKNMIRFPMALEDKQCRYDYICCHLFNSCIVLKDGAIYTCPRIAYINYFSSFFKKKINISTNDSLDIFQVTSFEEIAAFCSRRPDFCDYCALRNQSVHKWEQSSREMQEWCI